MFRRTLFSICLCSEWIRDVKRTAKAPYIEEGRLRHQLKVAAISGESPLRNIALLTAVYGTGMMLTEIARMPVLAYLNGDGSVRVKSCVDAAIAYNARERLVIGPTPRL
jgi:site-specific recombinase XerD